MEIKMNQVIGVVLTFVILVVFIGLALSFPVMLLWNYCFVPAVNGVNEIGWLQAWGLMILCSFLFKTTVSTK